VDYDMSILCISGGDLERNEFGKGSGTAWFFPPNNQDHHIHVEAASSRDCSGPDLLKITSVSIKTPGTDHGQNLRQIRVGPRAGKYDLSTPDIKWGNQEQAFKDALRNAGIGC
jgi:hypothetical protein